MGHQESVFVHPSAIVESSEIGPDTRVWAFAHVLADATIGAECNICDHVFVEGGVVIGDRVTVKNRVLLFDGVIIEDDAFVGPGVTFTNDKWPRSRRMASAAPRYEMPEGWLAPTRICRGASIGAGAIILCGITVGRYAMIGAGSVVTRDIEPYGLYAGNPAHRIWYVCQCGQRLNHSLACPACGMAFQHDEQGNLMEKSPVEELVSVPAAAERQAG